MISALAAYWKDMGIDTVVGRDFAVDADVGVLHIDLTRIPDEAIAKAPGGKPIVNGKVLDISKRRFSTLQLERCSDWDGEVIVKTNENYFGINEARARKTTKADENRAKMAKISWRSARRLPEKTYPVLASVALVPGWVWDDPSYIVERFMPERDGDLYVLRGWMFFGSRSYGWKLFATDPMVKAGSMVRHEFTFEVPDEIRAERVRSGFDFGKFDYVVHNDRAYLFDTNRTPTFVGESRTPRLENLAKGIEEFLSCL